MPNSDRIVWANALQDAFTTLKTDEQTFLRLSYFDGLSQARIAEIAGLSVAAVSRTLARAMQQLGRALEAPPSAAQGGSLQA